LDLKVRYRDRAKERLNGEEMPLEEENFGFLEEVSEIRHV
jgi:hypothetical protein